MSDPGRRDDEPPEVTSRRGWRYHHLGIPTEVPRPGERYLEEYGMYVSGFERSPFGIEWMRFEEDSPVHELVRNVPHIAFAVPDLEEALEGFELLSEIDSPSPGVRAAMILADGAPVELIEFAPDTKGPSAGSA